MADDIKPMLLLAAPKPKLVEPEPIKKMGRPSKKDPAVVDKVLELAKAGKTMPQIADILGIHRDTLYKWMDKDKHFFYAMREHRQMADEIVERALFERAKGYKHKAVKVFNNEGTIIEHEYVEHYAPDTNAAIFWLKNRQPDKWKDKTEVDSQVASINIVIDSDDLGL